MGATGDRTREIPAHTHPATEGTASGGDVWLLTQGPSLLARLAEGTGRRERRGDSGARATTCDTLGERRLQQAGSGTVRYSLYDSIPAVLCSLLRAKASATTRFSFSWPRCKDT
jgi:hypothetical protein